MFLWRALSTLSQIILSTATNDLSTTSFICTIFSPPIASIPDNKILVSDVQTTSLELLWMESGITGIGSYRIFTIQPNGDKTIALVVPADSMRTSVRARLTDLVPGRQYSIVVETAPATALELRVVQRTSK